MGNDVHHNNEPSSLKNNDSTSGIELNLNGDVAVEEVNDGDEDEGTDEIFIPGAVKNAAEHRENNNGLFVDDLPSPMDPPPPYQDHAPASSYDTTPNLPPPVVTTPLPPPAKSTGVFSSLFGNSSKKRLSKAELADAIELTKFALAALQKGDGDLGRERLEQALGVCRR